MESRGSTSAFPSLCLMGISRRMAAHHPHQDTGTCCRGLSLRIDALLYFSPRWSPSLHHECFSQTLGLLKLDCNSLCESRSVAVDSFIFKGMLSYGTAASLTKSLLNPGPSKRGDWTGWPWKVASNLGVWDSLPCSHHILWGLKWAALSCSSCCRSLGCPPPPPLAPYCLCVLRGST